MSRLLNKSEILIKFQNKYGDRFSYETMVFSTTRTPVEIICKKHGSFWKRPDLFLKGSYCNKCKYIDKKKKRIHFKQGIIK